jgi:alkylation response protein AidB-like acyl-CoA dehydrogenase
VAGAFCLSEATSASDAAAMHTTAVRDGDRYVLNGTKMWITSGAYAGVHIVMARTDPQGAHRGISAFVVEPSTPGFSVGPAEKKMGLRGSNTVPVILEDCAVDAGNLLGQEGDGFKIAMTALDGGRITIGAMATGIARAALDAAAAYALDRKAFGKPIGDFAAIQGKLADMATGIEAAELLVMRAAWLKDQAAAGGRRFTQEAATAKLFTTENAKRVCDEAIQIHGGYGYTREFAVERYYRDARVTTIFEGTSEIQKLVIAREVLARFAG